MLKGFKYRIYPTAPEEVLLHKHIGPVRLVYNLALEAKQWLILATRSGTSHWIQVQMAFRFNKTVAVYFEIEPRLDNLKIIAPPGLDQYFNRHFMGKTGSSLRINLCNSGG